MENNWEQTAKDVFNKYVGHRYPSKAELDTILYCMNLVFVATKKECANKAEIYIDTNDNQSVDKLSILEIQKPNL